MRQGYAEKIENFFKSNSEIQKSVENVDPEFKIIYRKIENKKRMNKFLRVLKPEIEPLVMARNWTTLNDAYQYSTQEENIYKNAEILRNKQKGS